MPEPERGSKKEARQARRDVRKDRRRKRKRIRRVDLRKAMFVLPNLFTVSSIFCGFYAITLCLDAPEPSHLRRAALAIFFGMFFDMFDGRVARLTRTQSEFGVQLDSLADLASFGVAPAILLYRWLLQDMGFVGLVGCFIYLTCGALRLARFNVLAAHGTGSGSYFLGLPIPLAAGTVVAAVLASYPFERPTPEGPIQITLSVTRTVEMSFGLLPSMAMVLAVILGLLMVSNVRYRSFKDFKPTKKSLTVATVLAVFLAIISVRIRPAVAMCILFLGYISVGLIEGIVFFPKRSKERREKRERAYEKADAEMEDPSKSPPRDDASDDPEPEPAG